MECPCGRSSRRGATGTSSVVEERRRSSAAPQERRALQGELWELEVAWRDAEEIAEISDNLLLPEGTDDFIEEHRESAKEESA